MMQRECSDGIMI